MRHFQIDFRSKILCQLCWGGILKLEKLSISLFLVFQIFWIKNWPHTVAALKHI